MGDQAKALDLSTAEAALERGDYGQCLELLAPMADEQPLATPDGSRIRLLMVTALMGQGREEDAVTNCRLLSRAGDPDLRQQARQLLSILEAPSLERPERWSMQLPELKLNATGSAAPTAARRRRSRKPPPPPPPPTGPTQAPALGFALLVSAVLLGLTVLLSGCVRIDADLSSPAPDRLQLHWQVRSNTDQMLPWQKRFETTLRQQHPEVSIQHERRGTQYFETELVSSAEMEPLLRHVMEIAGESAGISLPPAAIQLQERNWLVGVDQRMHLRLDLRDVPPIPGFELRLGLNQRTPSQPIKLGETAELAGRHWRWSPLGIGSLGIAVLLALTLMLQGIRRRLGFGFPELPS